MNPNSKESDLRNEDQEENVGKCLEDFEILRELGKGTFGSVYKVKSKINNKLYALKKPNDNEPKEKIKNKKEIFLLKHLNHENVCKCFSAFTSNDGSQFMVMEQYNNQDLYQYVNANKKMKKPIKEEILYNIIYQCLEGLSYIHNKGIVHCDIKLGNIFMTEEGKIVLGDFGESMIKPEMMEKYNPNPNEKELLKFERKEAGSPGFIAPDIQIEGCDEMSDVYSMGATFFALLYFQLPNEENKEFFFNQPFYSNELKNLIRKMIEPEKKNRIEIFTVRREFTKFYLQKYIKNSGFHSVTQCLLGFENLKDQLRSNAVLNTNSKSKEEKNKKKTRVCFILNSIMQNSNVENNNLILKKYFAHQLKTNLRENNDISPIKIVFYLINSLNNDLNKVDNSENNKNSQIKSNLNRKIQLENKTNVRYEYNNYITSYKKLFDSFIADKCLGVSKLTWTCHICQKQYISFEKFFSITFNINNSREQEINILDLFKKYNQNNIKIGLRKYVSCEHCNKFTEQTLNKKFYSIPNNLIILFDRRANNYSEIELKKEIKFDNQIAESNSQNTPVHTLCGIIYENNNINENENSQYVPLFIKNKLWYKYKYGQKEEKINLDNYYRQISKNVIALFYYIKPPSAGLFDDDDEDDNKTGSGNIPTNVVMNKVMMNNIQKFHNDTVFINQNQNHQNIPNNNQNCYNCMNNQNLNNNFNAMNSNQYYMNNNPNININNNQPFYCNNMNMNQNGNMINNNQFNNMQNNQGNAQNMNMNNNYNNQMNNNRYSLPLSNNNQLLNSFNNSQINDLRFEQMNNNMNMNPNFRSSIPFNFNNNNPNNNNMNFIQDNRNYLIKNNIANPKQNNDNNMGKGKKTANQMNMNMNMNMGMNNINMGMNNMNINNYAQANSNANVMNNNGINANNIGMNQFPNQINNYNMPNYMSNVNNMSNMYYNNNKK